MPQHWKTYKIWNIRMRIKKIFDIEKYTMPQMLLLIAFIIIVFPLILTIPAFFNFTDFSEKGEIGDTIGGITAPFINGLAAILVFLAFKEQIKANSLLKEQEQNSLILNQIHNIQANKEDFITTISLLQRRIGADDESLVIPLFRKIDFYLSEFEILKRMLEKNIEDSTLLFKKSQFLYSILFKDHLNELVRNFYGDSNWSEQFNTSINQTSDTIELVSIFFQEK